MGENGVMYKKCIELEALGEKGLAFAIGLKSSYFRGVNLNNYTD